MWHFPIRMRKQKSDSYRSQKADYPPAGDEVGVFLQCAVRRGKLETNMRDAFDFERSRAESAAFEARAEISRASKRLWLPAQPGGNVKIVTRRSTGYRASSPALSDAA